MKTQCIDSSKRMLHLLEDMVSDSEEPYNGIVWQLLCGPFTPFLTLFGEILSNGKGESEENEESLAAMEQLPVFLGKMSLRNSLAAKLERVAVVLVQHARSAIHPQGTCALECFELRSITADHQSSIGSHASEKLPDLSIPIGALSDPCPSNGNLLHWDSFFDHAMTAPMVGQPQIGSHESQPSDLGTWTNDFFGSAFNDWVRHSQV